MRTLEVLLGLLGAVAVVAGLARRLRMPAPILLVLAGLVVGLVPGVPRIDLDPEVVLVFILPPLLYAAALSTAFADFSANLRPIASLSVGLVLVSALAVGLLAHAVAPGLPLPVALALGAIVAPPDAIAATAVARRLDLPTRVMTILEGESLLNDATALVTYRIAVAAAAVGTVAWSHAVTDFAVSAAGGAAIGLTLAFLIALLRKRLDDPLLENTLSLLTPFAAYLPAEALHVSGVLSVVVAGLYLGRRNPALLSSVTRLQWQALWQMITFLLEGVVFALIGLQLPAIVEGLRGRTLGAVVTVAAVVVGTLVAVRLLWLFGVEYGLPRLFHRLRRVPGRRELPWRYPAVIGWAGMRGVVSLAAAFALPTDLPGRDLVLVVTFAVILVTLVLQGLSLPWVIRRLGLEHGGDAAERAEHDEAVADHHVARTALAELDHLVAEQPVPAVVKDNLRGQLEERVRRAHAILGGCPGEDEYHHVPDRRGDPVAEAASDRDLRRQVVAVERAELLRLYRAGDITDEIMRRVQRRLDFEELRLS